MDILEELEELKIGMRYRLEGEEVKSFPADSILLSRVEVEYKSLPGWKSPIGHVRRFQDLPPQAQDYVHVIEDFLGVPGIYIQIAQLKMKLFMIVFSFKLSSNGSFIPVKWIGVGQGRDAIIQVF